MPEASIAPSPGNHLAERKALPHSNDRYAHRARARSRQVIAKVKIASAVRRLGGREDLLIAGLMHLTNSLSAKGVAGPVCRGCSIRRRTQRRGPRRNIAYCSASSGPRAPRASRVRRRDASIRTPPNSPFAGARSGAGARAKQPDLASKALVVADSVFKNTRYGFNPPAER